MSLDILPLDPYHLTPSASLNRLRIIDLPGWVLEADVKGKTGYDLLSAHYLSDLIRQHADCLALSTDELAVDDRTLPVVLDRCFESGTESVRAAAREVAFIVGRNLAYLLLTLKGGDFVNRAARDDWDASYWDYWRTIQTVWLGGGLVSGYLGHILIDEVLPHLPSLPQVRRSPYAAVLPLVGAACHVPAGHASALVLDFGGSFVKRAVACYQHDQLVELHSLPTVAAQSTGEGETAALFEYMVTLIAQTWNEAVQTGLNLAPFVRVSLAAYMRDGQPLERQGGCYASLRLLSDNADHLLSQAVSQRLSREVQIRLLHDGSAAAAAYAGEPATAVIMLGTALGIGFPPLNPLLPIAAAVKITTS